MAMTEDVRGGVEGFQRDPGLEAVRVVAEAVAKGGAVEKGVPTDAVQTALEWLLSDDAVAQTYRMEINVGLPSAEKWVEWEIRPMDREALKRIRREADTANREAKRRGEQSIDATKQNLRIVAEATIDPDLAAAAARKGVMAGSSDPYAGATAVLAHRFALKMGLIDQIAGEVLKLSGYDEEDIREALAGKP